MAMAPFVKVAGVRAAFVLFRCSAFSRGGDSLPPRQPPGWRGEALVVACSPVFPYQLVQPMSDVPAAAL
jgi:hypothetical protein